MPVIESLLSLLWMLLCVVAIAVMAYLFTRYIAGRGGLGRAGASGNRQLRVIGRVSVGREQSVVLVQAGEKFYLLGVAASGVSVLERLTKEEAQEMCPAVDQPPPPGFTEALGEALRQRKQRWKQNDR